MSTATIIPTPSTPNHATSSPPTPKGSKRDGKRRYRWLWLEIAVPLTVIALIWVFSLGSTTFYLPTMPTILQSLADAWIFDRILSDLVPSLERLGIGLLIGMGGGIVLGFVFGSSAVLYKMYSPIIEFCRALPAPAVLPVLMLVLGIGTPAQVTLIAFGTVWPVLLSTMDGVRGIDGTMIDTARSLRVSAWDRLVHITMPGALPQVFAGMKTSLPLGIILMVISEMVGSANGVGYFVIESQRQFDMPGMWAGIILLGIIGFVLNAVFDVLERRALAWHHGSKARSD